MTCSTKGQNLLCLLYLPSIQTLKKDNAHGPHIHLIGDLWRFFADHKTLRRQVPGQDSQLKKNKKLYIYNTEVLPT